MITASYYLIAVYTSMFANLKKTFLVPFYIRRFLLAPNTFKRSHTHTHTPTCATHTHNSLLFIVYSKQERLPVAHFRKNKQLKQSNSGAALHSSTQSTYKLNHSH